MRAFTAPELTSMRSVQNSAMMDTCTLHVWTPTVDSYGTEIAGWTDTADVACGLDVAAAGSREVRRADGTITVVAATLRLPVDYDHLTAEDTVTVTHRNGELLSPALHYGFDGPPKRGPTGVTLSLVEVA